jgi:intracellular multiplication protein IcmC
MLRLWKTEWIRNIAIGMACVVLTSSVYAAPQVNIATMIENLAETIPQLMQLVTAFAYVLGFYMVIHGILLLKKHGESRTMMSQEHGLMGPLVFLFVGAGLIYLPTSINVGFATFWTHPTPYGYETGSEDPWAELLNACIMIIQLVGTIAFIRGLILLTHMGERGGQQGTFGKAMAHIIGGILTIDINDFMQAIWNTLALGQT